MQVVITESENRAVWRKQTFVCMSSVLINPRIHRKPSTPSYQEEWFSVVVSGLRGNEGEEF